MNRRTAQAMPDPPRFDTSDPSLRCCEHPGGCQAWKGMKLIPIQEADGTRTYHWFCETHRPADAKHETSVRKEPGNGP